MVLLIFYVNAIGQHTFLAIARTSVWETSVRQFYIFLFLNLMFTWNIVIDSLGWTYNKLLWIRGKLSPTLLDE